MSCRKFLRAAIYSGFVMQMGLSLGRANDEMLLHEIGTGAIFVFNREIPSNGRETAYFQSGRLLDPEERYDVTKPYCILSRCLYGNDESTLVPSVRKGSAYTVEMVPASPSKRRGTTWTAFYLTGTRGTAQTRLPAGHIVATVELACYRPGENPPMLSDLIAAMGSLLTVENARDNRPGGAQVDAPIASLPSPSWAQQFYSDTIDKYDDLRTLHESNRLHVLLVIDTNARNAANLGIRLNGERMINLLKSALRQIPDLEKRVSVKVLEGEAVNGSNIMHWFDNLASGSNDTVFFYYSGHGGTDKDRYGKVRRDLRIDQDSGHFLATSGGVVWRSDIKAAMAKSPAQLRILITDACASFNDAEIAKRAEESTSKFEGIPGAKTTWAAVAPTETEVNATLFRSLFFRHAGWVSINGAPTGFYSYGRPVGALFTSAFLVSLKTSRGQNAEFITDGTGWDRACPISVEMKITELGNIQVLTGQLSMRYLYCVELEE
jgi:hypothetical protein